MPDSKIGGRIKWDWEIILVPWVLILDGSDFPGKAHWANYQEN